MDCEAFCELTCETFSTLTDRRASLTTECFSWIQLMSGSLTQAMRASMTMVRLRWIICTRGCCLISGTTAGAGYRGQRGYTGSTDCSAGTGREVNALHDNTSQTGDKMDHTDVVNHRTALRVIGECTFT